MRNVLFITGTDTAVGKTLLTALLVCHLRQRGCHVLATKPFSSGSLADVRILARAQDHEIPVTRVNPFHFRPPVAPLVAARQSRRAVSLPCALHAIRSLAAECELLVIEGAGGLLAPLGNCYTAADLVQALSCPVLLVVRNKLGAVNHTLLTLAALRGLPAPRVAIVLMNQRHSNLATRTNPWLIAQMAPHATLFQLPFLGRNPTGVRRLKENSMKLEKTLARIVENATFCPAFRRASQQAGNKEKKPLASQTGNANLSTARKSKLRRKQKNNSVDGKR